MCVCVCICTAHRKKELILGGSGQQSFPTEGTRVVTLRLGRFPGGQVGQAERTRGNHFFSAKKR